MGVNIYIGARPIESASPRNFLNFIELARRRYIISFIAHIALARVSSSTTRGEFHLTGHGIPSSRLDSFVHRSWFIGVRDRRTFIGRDARKRSRDVEHKWNYMRYIHITFRAIFNYRSELTSRSRMIESSRAKLKVCVCVSDNVSDDTL